MKKNRIAIFTFIISLFILGQGCTLITVMAMGHEDRDVLEKYKIGKYRITYKTSIGWAGPRSFYYLLDKSGFAGIFFMKKKTYRSLDPNKCLVIFQSETKTYSFDLCQKKILP